ncbi:haloacetate dehalogenase, partial [Phenoliferia sp. Uapishka_3]
MFPASFKPTTTVFPSPESGSLASPTSIFALHHQPPAESQNVLVLLHGYPQNHTLWYEVVAELAKVGILEAYHVVIPDLPGYGQSRKGPSPDGSHAANSKRAVASDIVATVDRLIGPTIPFVIIGHDRGARVGYRMTKDFPERIKALCVQDIVPTKLVFEKMSYAEGRHRETFKSYHWIFVSAVNRRLPPKLIQPRHQKLALPSPIPEEIIGTSTAFFASNINKWTGSRFRGKFLPSAMASWVDQYQSHEVVTGALEDYRAGASIDLDHDEEDEKNGTETITCPLLSLYSVHLGDRFDVDGVWAKIAKGSFRSKKVGDKETGHFLPLEAVEETTREVVQWLKTF